MHFEKCIECENDEPVGGQEILFGSDPLQNGRSKDDKASAQENVGEELQPEAWPNDALDAAVIVRGAELADDRPFHPGPDGGHAHADAVKDLVGEMVRVECAEAPFPSDQFGEGDEHDIDAEEN